jgi:hypothetical protein
MTIFDERTIDIPEGTTAMGLCYWDSVVQDYVVTAAYKIPGDYRSIRCMKSTAARNPRHNMGQRPAPGPPIQSML